MDSIPMKSRNRVAENINIIKQFFPQCVLETMNAAGEMMLKVDMDSLHQEFAEHVLGGREQRYVFTWPQKRESIHLTNLPITKTLRPCKEESVDFDKTKNLYIEGDNLDVLKLLQETYLGKIKMIYIDPPYNTGNDFVYEDDYSITAADWKGSSNEYDEDGNRLFKNTSANGRFHTDWLNMMYPRLRLAKDLLREDGVIFISIDDNEVHNLRKICDEIFGACNFVAQIPWRKRTAKSDVPFGVSQDYEWLICYCKPEFIACIKGKERQYYTTPDFPNRPWRVHDLTKQTSANERPNSFFVMKNPKTGEEYPANPNRTWAISKDKFEEYYNNNRIVFPGDYDFLKSKKPAFRYFKEDDMRKAGQLFGYTPMSTNLPQNIGMSQDGTKDFNELFSGKLFGFPKPVSLIKHLLQAALNHTTDALVVDFFSGSASTAHALMQLNAEDGGNRRFILVQLPEQTEEKSEAFKAGYSNICEIGKERIRRAAAKIKEENPLATQGADLGFRVLKLAESNMADVFYDPNKVDQNLFEKMVSNVKDGRTGHDLLFQIMLSLGIELSHPIHEEQIEDKRVYTVGEEYVLIACFDSGLSHELLSELAQRKPYHFVTHDAALANDSLSTNVEHIFKCLSPNTNLHVL